MQEFSSKEHIIAALRKGMRLDGRKLDEFRPITIEIGTIASAEGSATVSFGNMKAIAGVKLSLGTPYPDRPGSGVLMVNAELLPLSNPEFEPGPPGIDSIETSRVIDRGIRESKTVDEEALCVKEGEKVWITNVDVCPINTDGPLIDIGGLASIAALKNARFPKIEDSGVVNYKEITKKQLPVSQLPLPITVCKIGDVLLVDPTHDEWNIVDARLTVTTLEDGRMCSLQKGGSGSLTVEDIDKMIDLAAKKAGELRKELAKALK